MTHPRVKKEKKKRVIYSGPNSNQQNSENV